MSAIEYNSESDFYIKTELVMTGKITCLGESLNKAG